MLTITGAEGLASRVTPTEVVVGNVRLDPAVQAVDVRELRVVDEGKELLPLLEPWPTPGYLEHGQGLLFPRAAPIAPAVERWWWEAYLADGPPLGAGVPLEIIDRLTDWGPSPDPPVTSSTGSGRLFARRVPAGIAGLIAWRYGLTARLLQPGGWLETGRRWAAAQLLRGSGACWGEDLGTAELYTWALSFKGVEKRPVMHQGYTKSATAKGGWHTFKGAATLPPGVTWEGSGLQVCDHLHLATDQCAVLAALTGSWAAAWSVFRDVEACVGLYATAPSDAGLRGAARLMQSIAVGYEPCRAAGLPVAHWPSVYVPWLLGLVEERNVHVQRGSFVGLDFGNSVDGGHLMPHHIEHLRPMLEGLGWTLQDAARSTTPWMTLQWASACDDLIRFVRPLDDETRQRAMVQIRVAGSSAVFQGQAPAYDVEKREMRSPTVCWDDVAPGQRDGHTDLPSRLAMGGEGNWASEVGIRFAVPGLLACATRLGSEGDPARTMAAAIEAKAAGNYNGKPRLDWVLEAWVGVESWA